MLYTTMFSSLTLLLMLVCAIRGENPAFQVVLSNKGLQYGSHVGAGWIQDKLNSVTIPDVSGKISLGIFGNINYQLSGFQIIKCDFPEPKVEFSQPLSGISTSILGLSIALTGNYKANYGFIKIGGSMQVALFNVDVTSLVNLGKDDDGHLSVTSNNCMASIEAMDIRVHGGSSWITQFIINQSKGWIKTKIEKSICVGVEDLTADLECHLKAMNVSLKVNENLLLEVPLTRAPVIDASSLNLGLKGEFLSLISPQEPPFQAQNFTMSPQSAFMLSVGLSDFTVNSASYSLFSDGLLQENITDSLIPPESPVHLNTSYMGSFIPQLPVMFPGLMMALHVYAREFPAFCFQASAIKLTTLGAVKAFVILPNSTLTPVFTLHVESEFSGKTWITDQSLKGSVMMDNFTLTLADTQIGTFKTDPLENAAKFALKSFVLVKLNERLAQGFDLPKWKQAQLVNTVLKMEEGFIGISTDAAVQLQDAAQGLHP
ncbi:bactericidal permeability-increasing protein [Synchiropus splendidus]|uniref:bactericidal permeability-increasing protein n=1 Tax=Synchiropus splendidus TaxID=270530 RepID=UPI00237E7F74|nr:bactericidal permeability-increasing protein [Synchiropus splendidus]